LAALIASVVLSGPDLRQGRYMLLDVAAMVFFAALSILAIFLDRPDLD
jgi:hypothetical protein